MALSVTPGLGEPTESNTRSRDPSSGESDLVDRGLFVRIENDNPPAFVLGTSTSVTHIAPDRDERTASEYLVDLAHDDVGGESLADSAGVEGGPDGETDPCSRSVDPTLNGKGVTALVEGGLEGCRPPGPIA